LPVSTQFTIASMQDRCNFGTFKGFLSFWNMKKNRFCRPHSQSFRIPTGSANISIESK
jgi:hypothetical protein